MYKYKVGDYKVGEVGDYVSISIDKNFKQYFSELNHNTVRIIKIEENCDYFDRFEFEFSDGTKIFSYNYNIVKFSTKKEISKYVGEIRRNKLKQLEYIETEFQVLSERENTEEQL